MNKIPEINITTNKNLDTKTIAELAEMNDKFMEIHFKDYRKDQNLTNYIINKYLAEKNNLSSKIRELENKLNILEEACKIISEIMGDKWEKINKINVFIGFCPIIPRFLDTKSFILPYELNVNIKIHFSVHEIIHFLYFQKWAKIYKKDSIETFESPHQNWILSEIIAPVIMRDGRIFDLIKTESNLYPEWKKIDDQYKYFDEFLSLYYKTSDFEDFLIEAKKKYYEIDNKINLTSLLTSRDSQHMG
ncbi:hypothetical protein COY62_02405 [bacterium (Candidatus Howlettbacteria) CG_4_10_14_0_8_um_filter_40_9]|nr:MAG: hypothetical protein COY62_02405 [bacterium (Candidatus Howlettbacteria) CG_4_10_14_0_8_um_filter_40_9]